MHALNTDILVQLGLTKVVFFQINQAKNALQWIEFWIENFQSLKCMCQKVKTANGSLA